MGTLGITSTEIIVALEICRDEYAKDALYAELKRLPIEQLKQIFPASLFEKLMFSGRSLSARWLAEHVLDKDVVDASVVFDAIDKMRDAKIPLSQRLCNENLELLHRALWKNKDRVTDVLADELWAIATNGDEGSDEPTTARWAMACLCAQQDYYVDYYVRRIKGLENAPNKRGSLEVFELLAEIMGAHTKRAGEMFALGQEVAAKFKINLPYEFLIPNQGMVEALEANIGNLDQGFVLALVKATEQAERDSLYERAVSNLQALTSVLKKRPELATQEMMLPLFVMAFGSEKDDDGLLPPYYARKLLNQLVKTRRDLFNEELFTSIEKHITEQKDTSGRLSSDYGRILQDLISRRPSIATRKLCEQLIGRLDGSAVKVLKKITKRNTRLAADCIQLLTESMQTVGGSHVYAPILFEHIIHNQPQLAEPRFIVVIDEAQKRYSPNEYFAGARGAVTSALQDRLPNDPNSSVWRIVGQIKVALG